MDPNRLLAHLAFRISRSRCRPLRRALVASFMRAYAVDLGEALSPDPDAYPSFNDFFTRALRPGARPVDESPGALVSPCDGALAAFGQIGAGTVLQAKGMPYSVGGLLGGDAASAVDFEGGAYLTVYLAPRDYHRAHMPAAGVLDEMRYVPGRLLSVRPATVARVPGLFARNERVASLFRTERGPLAVVLVGATMVGGIEQVWCGPVTPPHARTPRRWRYREPSAPRLARGEEMGRFNMGSTVVVLTGWPVRWDARLAPGARVRCGQRLGSAAGLSPPAR